MIREVTYGTQNPTFLLDVKLLAQLINVIKEAIVRQANAQAARN